MSRYALQEDSGQFQDSMVELNPVRFTQKMVSSPATQTTRDNTNLGIYDSIKLSSLISRRQGNLLQFVTLNPNSKNTFVTKEATQLLNQYSTNEIAFVIVMANHQAGKSFFCDKILNLAEVKGNHFCRNSNIGLHLWSTPFQKDNLKIFLMQISGCAINSSQFRILSTYTLMIGSVFVLIDDLNKPGISVIYQADAVFSDIIDQIVPNNLEGQQEINKNRSIFMPNIIYNLKRANQKRNEEHLSVLSVHVDEQLPDALQRNYQGSPQDLKHLSFMDKNCISEEYIRRTSFIFKQIHEKISEKRYKELILNGNIILKIIKYIETYLNNKYPINIESLYEQVIEDLYLSAFNYCILSYHQEMERQFQSEQPKPLAELLNIFELKSENIINKFNQFTLDSKLHYKYQEKLVNHINEKEIMIMDINEKKTEIQLNKCANSINITNYVSFKYFVDRLNIQKKELTHGKARFVGQIAYNFYHQLNTNNNVEFLAMKEIEKLKKAIVEVNKEYDLVKKQGMQKSKLRSQINEKNEAYRRKQKELDDKIRKTKNECAQIQSSTTIPADLGDRISSLQATFNLNMKKIQDLKQNPSKKKNTEVASRQNRLIQVQKKIQVQQNLLRQLNESKTSQARDTSSLPKAQKKKTTVKDKKPSV